MLTTMGARLSIGEFSKMTYLSVKALRHYHDVGLLEPATIDPSSGYRFYDPGQIATAQAIRRFRDLDMPIDEVRTIIDAPDLVSRNQAILTHLDRLHAQLERTQASVASLQSLLAGDASPSGPVEIRRLPRAWVVQTTASVRLDDCAAWLEPALADLHATAARDGLVVTGADGALYTDAFFQEAEGEVTAFVPVGGETDQAVELAAATFAVLVYRGSFADLDQAYGALGTAVAERGIAGAGPIREHYLTDTVTEVCWPVRADAAR